MRTTQGFAAWVRCRESQGVGFASLIDDSSFTEACMQMRERALVAKRQETSCLSMLF
jgi:hypothetical protein